MKEKGDSRYKRFIETAFREVSRVLKQYSDRFSKKTYTQRQLAVAILLMKYEDKTYRDIADLLTEFADYFKFEDSTPHFTTLQKFFLRIPTYVWEFLLTKTYELFAGNMANVAIDSTGYRLHHASQHYEQRIGRKRNRKRFMKHILSIDSGSQAIIVSDSRRSCINDNITFRPILQKTKDIIDVDNATADKGYDSEENHRFAHKEICANSVIPLRYEVPLRRTTGFYRRKLRRSFPYDIYHQRSKVETVNSVQKRKFGDELRSRLLKMQRRKMKVIDIVYNIHRYINYFVSVFLGFLQSLTNNSFAIHKQPNLLTEMALSSIYPNPEHESYGIIQS